MNKKNLSAFAVLVVLIGLGASQVVSAQTATPQPSVTGMAIPHMGEGGERKFMGPRKGHGIGGTVASISGNTITVTAQQFHKPTSASAVTAPAAVTYTVDATNATVMKNGTASSLSAIAVGDRLMVTGTVNGTNVTATKINDGMGNKMGENGEDKVGGMQNLPAGNGQPIVGGTVSSVTGTSVTITNSTGTTYTIDASNAKINKSGVATSTISNVAVGDMVIVQGAVNGSYVTANSIIDRGVLPAQTAQTTSGAPVNAHLGFFGSIGGFFKHMFGF